MTAERRYCLFNWDNLTLPIQILLCQKQQKFSPFVYAYLKSTLNFEHFQKKQMNLIADVSRKFRTPKNVIR